MGRREALSRASVPWPETVLRIAHVKLLRGVLRGPIVLQALLLTPAGSQWQQSIKADLSDLKAMLPDILRALPSLAADSAP